MSIILESLGTWEIMETGTTQVPVLLPSPFTSPLIFVKLTSAIAAKNKWDKAGYLSQTANFALATTQTKLRSKMVLVGQQIIYLPMLTETYQLTFDPMYYLGTVLYEIRQFIFTNPLTLDQKFELSLLY